jgi:glycosyltransferase involved in cell wall biosynthesis
LQAQIPASMTDRVKWLGFMDDQKTLSAIYRLSDVLVLPSDYEPWGVVINEAAAAGMAIVASDQVASAHELVIDGLNGHLFPAGDGVALSRALEQAIAHLDDYKKGSAVALQCWRERGDPVNGLRQALADQRVLV